MRISEDSLTLEEITNDDINENGQLKAAIPNSVTSIGNRAFNGCTNLTNITMPESVTSIDAAAFSLCTSLTNITIPNSVTSIGEWEFYGCTSLTNITIPNSVTRIDNYVFAGCTSLTNITIPNSVTSIDDGAFNGCTNLTNITIPNSVKSIGCSAFYDCKSLTNITIANSVTSVGYYAFRGCTSLTSIVIASEDDEVIAQITALLSGELQDKVVTKAAYIKAKAIQSNALAKIENDYLSPELESALPNDLHLLVAGYVAGEHVADQVKQAMQALPIPAIDDSQGWIDYAAQVNAIAAQEQQQQQQQQQREAEFTTAHPIIAFAINHPYATSETAGLLTTLAAATISTLGVAPALAAATGLSATAATYTAAATVGVIACTATFFAIPSSIPAYIASQNKNDEQDELGANVAPAAI